MKSEGPGTAKRETAAGGFGLALARAWKYGSIALRVGIPALVVWLVWRELSAVDLHGVRQTVAGVSRWRLLPVLVTPAMTLAIFGLYDVLAFPTVPGLSAPRRWGVGILVGAWTNFLAVGPLAGPALRVYLYRRHGIETDELLGRLANLYTGMVAGFLAATIGAVLPLGSGVPAIALRCAVAVVLSPLLVLAVAALRRWLPFVSDPTPGAPLVRLALVGVVDWAVAGLVFVYSARAVGIGAGAMELIAVFFVGVASGFVSMVPGGLGSADAVWISLIDGLGVDPTAAASHVLLFRTAFYLLPWVASLLALYVFFSRRWEDSVVWQRRLIAVALALDSFLLMASAAVPGMTARLDWLTAWLPLGVIEASHAVTVGAAVLMLFLVRGILRGYRSSFLIVTGALSAAVVANLASRVDPAHLVLSLLLLFMLLGGRRAFVKPGRVPLHWELVLATTVAALTFFLVVGLIGGSRTPYESALWLRFTPAGDASRFLRGIVVLAVVCLAFMIRQAMVPPREARYAGTAEIDEAVRFLQQHSDRAALLSVACGDKAIWRWRDAGLVVFQRRNDKLVVLNDPVVAEGQEAALLEDLLDHGRGLDLDVVFYATSSEWMVHLHDFGYQFFKLGEEGIVDIHDYSLSGAGRKEFRRAIRRGEEAGISYRVAGPPLDAALIDRARDVSDAWLAEKDIHEMQFSLGYFSPGYLRRFPLAMATDRDGRMVAFVNVLGARPGSEVTLDFVRYRSGIVDDLMDYVVVNTMMWARDAGYQRFSLGMAPLFDVGAQPASVWSERMARIAYLHGERLYNYRGLQAYKAKFDPRWEPRFLAYRRPWDGPGTALAVLSLVQARSRQDRRRIAAARLGNG